VWLINVRYVVQQRQPRHRQASNERLLMTQAYWSSRHMRLTFLPVYLLTEYDHRLRGSASPVLTATGFVNGKWQFSTPQNRHPSTDHQKFVIGDYVGDPYSCAKLGAYPSTGGFWAHRWNITKIIFIYTFLETHLQVRHVDGFSRMMAQTTRTRARMCLFGDFFTLLPI